MNLVRMGQNSELNGRLGLRLWRRELGLTGDGGRNARDRRGRRRQRRRSGMHFSAQAASGRAGDGNKLAAGKEKFAGLRNDQPFAGELMFQPQRPARRQHAKRIVELQAHVDISRAAADVERRGDDCRRENAQRRAGGKLDAQAAEIQSSRDGCTGLQQREFCGPTDIEVSSGEQRQARLAGVNRYDSAVRDKNILDCCSRRRVWNRSAALNRNVLPLDLADRASRKLRAERCGSKERERQQECCWLRNNAKR